MASDTPKHARHVRIEVENSPSISTASVHPRASHAKAADTSNDGLSNFQRYQQQKAHSEQKVGRHATPTVRVASHQAASPSRHAASSSRSAGYATPGHAPSRRKSPQSRLKYALPVAAAAAALVVGVGAGTWMLGSNDSVMTTTAVLSDAASTESTTAVTTQSSVSHSRIITQVSAEEKAAQEQREAEEEALREADRAELDYQIALIEAQNHTKATMAELMDVPELFLAQQGSDTCTLCSNTMMLRRAAYLDGRTDWEDITESALAGYAWSWAGVPWYYSAFGYEVEHCYMESGSDEPRLLEIVQLLSEHPEGVVLYDPYVPHAVLAIYYDEETGVLYCADPANTYSGSALPVDSTWNGAMHGGDQTATINGFTEYWCITSAE